MRSHLPICLTAVVYLFAATSAFAQTVAFTEGFSSGPANWATTNENLLAGYQPTGGSDGGGYLESETLTFDGDFNSSFPGAPAFAVLFRARDDYDSSGDAFFGNWVEEEYVGLAFSIRHNATRPLSFFARIADPNNNPGASVSNGQMVTPGEWVDVVLDVSRGSDQIDNFGSAGSAPDPYGAVFDRIGRIQIAAIQPFGLTQPELDADLLFELDNVRLLAVPEPASAGLVVCGILFVAMRLGARRIRC